MLALDQTGGRKRSPESGSDPCPYCYGTGWDISEGARPCQCRQRNRAGLLLAEAHIPKRYENCTLANYDPQGTQNSQSFLSQAKAVLDCKHLVREYPNIDCGLLFVGPCGVGKTHLAVAVVKELINKANAR